MDVNWKEVGLVIVSGAIGGVLSFVYSVTVGKPPAIEGHLLAVAAYMFLGAGSGYLGVYLIARTDTRHLTHCLGFAVACGVAWAPIMDATVALVRQTAERQLEASVENLTKKVKDISTELREGTDEDLPTKIDRLTQAVSQLVETSAEADSAQVKFKALASTSEALEGLETAVDRNPEKASWALNDIAISAILNGETAIATDSLRALRKVSSTATEPRLIPVVYEIGGRIAEVARAKGDIYLAMDARLLRSDAVLGVGEKALEREDFQTIRSFPGRESVEADLQNGQKFYEALGDSLKVQEIERKLFRVRTVYVTAGVEG